MAMWKELVLIAFLTATLGNVSHAALGVRVPATSQQFFLEGKEPYGLTGDVVIEQMFNAGGPYFATMYSIVKRSPVYSAYRVLPADAAHLQTYSRPSTHLREYKGDPGHGKVYKANTPAGYTRGHLNPSCINSYSREAMKSTFTYSNVVPQWKKSNGGSWNRFEGKLVTYANDCGKNGGTLFLLTGPADFGYDGSAKMQVPPVRIYNAGKTQSLPVPPVLWTAGCCWKKNTGSESLGVIGVNKEAAVDAVTYEGVDLSKLQTLLGNVRLFPGDANGDCENKTATLV